MGAASRQERRPKWIGRLPVTLTPNEFHNLVHARVSCRSSPKPPKWILQQQPQHVSSDIDAPTSSKFSKEQYLRAFKSLSCSPKPSDSWLGSTWQRRKAESLLSQTAPLTRVLGETASNSAAGVTHHPQSKDRNPTESDSGPPDAFLLELQARRRDELRKSREKQEERRRLQEEQAKTNIKVICLTLVTEMVCEPPSPHQCHILV